MERRGKNSSESPTESLWQVDSDVCGTLQPQAIMTSPDETAVLYGQFGWYRVR